MSYLDIIKAWKDPEYRMGLSEDQRALLPEHPAGPIELTEAQLEEAAGGLSHGCTFTRGGETICCTVVPDPGCGPALK